MVDIYSRTYWDIHGYRHARVLQQMQGKSLLMIFIADTMMVNGDGDNVIIMAVIVNIYLERIGQ